MVTPTSVFAVVSLAYVASASPCDVPDRIDGYEDLFWAQFDQDDRDVTHVTQVMQ